MDQTPKWNKIPRGRLGSGRETALQSRFIIECEEAGLGSRTVDQTPKWNKIPRGRLGSGRETAL
ncbi:MAG TPA: hypothetical protein H9946_02260, partial [Candidatus Jeotgalibaca pullicola]|nr:hypothetical protein [Candidatus Jeotgalibaca pullicola]